MGGWNPIDDIIDIIDDIVDGIYRLLNKAPSINSKKKFKNDSLSPVAPFRILNIGNTKKNIPNTPKPINLFESSISFAFIA